MKFGIHNPSWLFGPIRPGYSTPLQRKPSPLLARRR